MKNNMGIEVVDPEIAAPMSRETAVRRLRDQAFISNREKAAEALITAVGKLNNRGMRGRELGLMQAAVMVDPNSNSMCRIAEMLLKDARKIRRPTQKLLRMFVIGGLSEPFDTLRQTVVAEVKKVFPKVACNDPTTAAAMLKDAYRGVGAMEGRIFMREVADSLGLSLNGGKAKGLTEKLAEEIGKRFPPPSTPAALKT